MTPPGEEPWSVVIRNEFAMVELALAPSPSGPVLRITDLVKGPSITLDAMELEGLCWLAPGPRARLLDQQWRTDGAVE